MDPPRVAENAGGELFRSSPGLFCSHNNSSYHFCEATETQPFCIRRGNHEQQTFLCRALLSVRW